jgi:exodeoxyribonuclease X
VTGLDRPWREVSWVVVDVEGNGQQPPDLVEAACLPVDSGQPGATRTWLVHPPRPINGLVTRIHGIRGADADKPPIAAVAEEIRAALAGRIVVGHQVRVDVAVLSRELSGWAAPATVDTLRLAKAVWPGLPSYGLDALAYAARIPPPADAPGGRHRAGYDAALTAALFLALAEASDSGGHHLSAADLVALASPGAAINGDPRLF